MMSKKILLYAIPAVAATDCIFYGVTKRMNYHHDIVFCTILDEIWADPKKQGWENRIAEMESYLDSGFWNVFWNYPQMIKDKKHCGRDAILYSRQFRQQKITEIKELAHKMTFKKD